MKFKSIWSCDEDQNKIVPAGTTVMLPFVWSYGLDGLTPFKDIEITLETEIKLGEALALVEQEALDYVKSVGADDIRQYYIEGVSIDDGVLIFHYGT